MKPQYKAKQKYADFLLEHGLDREKILTSNLSINEIKKLCKIYKMLKAERL